MSSTERAESAIPAKLTCQGCGVEIPPSRGGPARKWCSDRCRKVTLYSKRCPDCGTTINTNGSIERAPARCVPCTGAHSRAVTRRWIIDSINEWADLFGAPPSAGDWNPAMSIAKGMEWRAERHAATERPWPNPTVVIDNFGSWNAGIAAAGWEPREVGNYGRDGEDMAVCEQIAALYRDGLTTTQLAERFGVSHGCIIYRLKKVGQPRRARGRARAAA